MFTRTQKRCACVAFTRESVFLKYEAVSQHYLNIGSRKAYPPRVCLLESCSACFSTFHSGDNKEDPSERKERLCSQHMYICLRRRVPTIVILRRSLNVTSEHELSTFFKNHCKVSEELLSKASIPHAKHGWFLSYKMYHQLLSDIVPSPLDLAPWLLHTR